MRGCWTRLNTKERYLNVHLNGRLASKLVAGEIGVVTAVDKVVVEGLRHVLMESPDEGVDDCVVFAQQVAREAVHRQVQILAQGLGGFVLLDELDYARCFNVC